MTWSDLDNLSQFIMNTGGLAWFFYAVVLIFLLIKKRTDVSSLLSVSVWVLADLIVIWVTPSLYRGIESGQINSLYWYPIFIGVYALASFSIVAFHKALQLPMSKTSVLVLGLLLVLTLADSIMHVDRLTGLVLESFYHFAIPAFKILAAALLFQSCYRIKE